VSAGDRHHRPHGLPKSAGKQSGVRDGRREVAANSDTRTRADHSRALLRITAHRLAPGLASDARARSWRDDGLLLLLSRTGKDHEPDRSRVGQSFDSILFSRWRFDDGFARGLRAEGQAI